MSRFEALLGAARRRARPFVMISTAVIGGLITSTMLSLAFVGRHPVLLLAERSGADSHATATPRKDPGHAHPRPVSFVG